MKTVAVNMGRASDLASLFFALGERQGYSTAEIGMACLVINGLITSKKLPEGREAMKDWLEKMSMAIDAVCNPEGTVQ